jgi:hypothetical protein
MARFERLVSAEKQSVMALRESTNSNTHESNWTVVSMLQIDIKKERAFQLRLVVVTSNCCADHRFHLLYLIY